jgi:drug/metabolite transporter (DMT)-like permease
MLRSNISSVQNKAAISAWLALGTVCILWGTTYLAIRIALQSFPPFYLMGLRYFLSGIIMVAGARFWGAALPKGRNLWLTALYGITTIGFGTGLLCVAEQWVPSGLSALFIATQPFWMVIMEWILSRGRHYPEVPTLIGLLIGIGGVAVLVAPAARQGGLNNGIFFGFLMLQLGCAGWVTGALLQKRLGPVSHPIVAGAVQQLATGFCFGLLGLLFERMPVHVTPFALGGVLYLVVFGAIIGYSAFIYAMDRLPSTIVSVYTFVNPVVAVFLGWLLFREPFGTREIMAMVLIFIGIAIVRFRNFLKPRSLAAAGSQVSIEE